MPSTPQERRKPADHIVELKQLVVGYAKQETVDPLRTLGRYLLFGVLGAIFVGGGSLFLMLGTLRALEARGPFQTPGATIAQHQAGARTLVPYAVAIAVGIVVVVLSVVAIIRDGKGDAR
jgi:amino acid transporter